jgi:hypothetical protein
MRQPRRDEQASSPLRRDPRAYEQLSAAPHLFGESFEAFEANVRILLCKTAPRGTFAEQARGVELVIWLRP